MHLSQRNYINHIWHILPSSNNLCEITLSSSMSSSSWVGETSVGEPLLHACPACNTDSKKNTHSILQVMIISPWALQQSLYLSFTFKHHASILCAHNHLYHMLLSWILLLWFSACFRKPDSVHASLLSSPQSKVSISQPHSGCLRMFP